ALFEDAIKEIEADLPDRNGPIIPNALLYCTTALLLLDDSDRFYSGRKSLRLKRGKGGIKVGEQTWAMVVRFMVKYGWKPSVDRDSYLSDVDSMNEADARSFAATGHIVMFQGFGDPGGVQIRFDLTKFAQIIDFASEGEFEIVC